MRKEYFGTPFCLLLVLVISMQVGLLKSEETTASPDKLATENVRTRKLEDSDEDSDESLVDEDLTTDVHLTSEIAKKHLNETQKECNILVNDYVVVYNYSRKIEKIMADTLKPKIWKIIDSNAELNGLKDTMAEVFPAVWKIPKRRECRSELDQTLAKEFSQLTGIYNVLANNLVDYLGAEHIEVTRIYDLLAKMNNAFGLTKAACKTWSKSCESGPDSNDPICKRIARKCLKKLPVQIVQNRFRNKVEEVKARYGNVEKDFQSIIEKNVESKLKKSIIPSVRACLA